ncbi:DUF2891 domain-containing protein [Acidisphaera sp. S103]|uniref:DUF2891 domain-containing protein n=1 Tax=Acidisphaera sp. S103 TaxID=1747223 RepID=UPI00131D538B|nr:DUF2891 domain-containing protein [Acidisphaera sp. S103]
MEQDLAHAFAGIALGHVTREYPNKLDHVLAGPQDVRGPRDLHPVFYGSFDWHSCVHGYWMLANLYRRFPGMPRAGAIRALFDAHLVPDLVAAECAYLDRPASRGFERPYGWAWLLKLAAELALHETPEGRAWAAALQPLARAFAARFMAFLPLATYPIRAGVHTNTAFAVRLALDYPDSALRALLTDTVRRWYAGDAGCQAWEPGGDEFLSPTLIEAECMRAALPDAEFRGWFAGFLPQVGQGLPASLFTPAIVSDRSDGKIAHLDGLNLSRAWCWQALAAFTPDPEAIRRTAQAHVDASLPHVGGDYMGEHWLCSFAVLALGGG